MIYRNTSQGPKLDIQERREEKDRGRDRLEGSIKGTKTQKKRSFTKAT